LKTISDKSSSLSVGFGKIDSMKFSPYLQQCLKELQDAKEHESDAILDIMVNVQNITERVVSLNGTASELSGIPRAPVSAYVTQFQAELDKIKDSLGNNLRENSKQARCKQQTT
jgi:hypothetical protein